MLFFLFALILDSGFLLGLGTRALPGFWTGVAIILVRRPRNPTEDDLMFVRLGYVLALGTAIGLLFLMAEVVRLV